MSIFQATLTLLVEPLMSYFIKWWYLILISPCEAMTFIPTQARAGQGLLLIWAPSWSTCCPGWWGRLRTGTPPSSGEGQAQTEPIMGRIMTLLTPAPFRAWKSLTSDSHSKHLMGDCPGRKQQSVARWPQSAGSGRSSLCSRAQQLWGGRGRGTTSPRQLCNLQVIQY